MRSRDEVTLQREFTLYYVWDSIRVYSSWPLIASLKATLFFPACLTSLYSVFGASLKECH